MVFIPYSTLVSGNLVKNPIKATFGSNQYGLLVDSDGLSAQAVGNRKVRGGSRRWRTGLTNDARDAD